MLSVIVPVYNVEKYLKRCVESILAQTERDLEIILVDDGSPDNCGVICDEYSGKDKRIQVVHQKNGGVSTALNIALKEMTGDYFSWLSHDDYYYPEKVEKEIIFLNENNLLEIECEGALYKLTTMNPEEFPELPKIEVENSIDLEQNMLRNMIRRTIFAVSSEENRPIFTGCLFEVKENKLNVVAVDGFRLAWKSKILTKQTQRLWTEYLMSLLNVLVFAFATIVANG